MNETRRADEPPFDKIARRVNLYAGALLSLASACALVAVLAAQAVSKATEDLRTEAATSRARLEARLEALASEHRAKSRADSIRFERTLAVVELAVVALVEPESEDGRSAVAELRRRRHVTPRRTED